MISSKSEKRVVAVILAAGKATRMGEGGSHKLLAEFDGVPLVRCVALAALAARSDVVVVVSGHRRQEVIESLGGLDLIHVQNSDYASGMATSLVAGLLSNEVREADGALVMLADMPGISADDLNRLIDAYRLTIGPAIIRAVSKGKSGNPVILPRAIYSDVMRLQGDVGARDLIVSSGLPIIDVEIVGDAHLDVDTPEAIVAAGGVLKA